MFEFFIALFGGLFYGGKYHHEKSKIKEYDKNVAKKESYQSSLKSRICASFQDELSIKENILSGKYFDDICIRFEDDFKYVFGSNWRETLRIPPQPPVLNPKIYKKDAYSFFVPANHIYWVYRLMLADCGKVESTMFAHGYLVGGIQEKDISVKFAQCIEKHLYNAGVDDIRLVLEQRDSSDIGCIKIESLCNYHSRRLW